MIIKMQSLVLVKDCGTNSEDSDSVDYLPE